MSTSRCTCSSAAFSSYATACRASASRGYVLGAGAAELVARIAVCLLLPPAIAGGAVSAAAPPLAFYALCAADPMAWIASDAVLLTPFIRNILRQDYKYLRRNS